jgi:hypothetical protein
MQFPRFNKSGIQTIENTTSIHKVYWEEQSAF